MKFKIAINKLKKVASGRYCSIQYEQTFYQDGDSRAECKLYIEGLSFAYAPTWHQAFHLLNKSPVKPKKSEAPNEE